jgi:trimeric autotransporter adhesin
MLDGGDGNDALDGGDGDDALDGGVGADKMSGGAGDDTYWVDDVGDELIEETKKGLDTVYAAVDLTLSANIENLTLVDGAIAGTGNEQSNRIIGNGGDNILDGGVGNDELQGGLGNDTLYGSAGADSISGDDGADLAQGGDGNDSLNGNNGNDALVGGEGNDAIFGGSGNDQLDGGAGADGLSGGSGNDTYIVDDAGDVVSESSGQGTADVVQSSISYTLTSNVERLTLTGTSGIDGTGNSLANLITGNDGANVLDGSTGNDTVDGGAGNDLVKGGAGNDTLSGQGGIDTLEGGDGNDILVWDADDSLNGGANRDTLLHTGTGAIDVDTAKLSNIEVVNLGAGDDNDNGIILSVQDVLDLAATSSGSGFSKNGDVIDLLIYGDNATTTRDNVELGGSWAAAGTFSTSALTGSTITFNIYQASGTQVAVQQGLDLTIV